MEEQTSLADRIKDHQAPVFETENLDLPIQELEEETPVEAAEEEAQAEMIQISPLNVWFEANSSVFENISQVKVSIRGVDPEKTLIMSVNDGLGEVDGHPSRDLQVFKNADVQPVLNIPAVDMQVYNNGFRLLHPYGDEILIKCYGVRTGLICVFCHQSIPYQVTKIKKKDEAIEVVRTDTTAMNEKLALAADTEAIQLLYKQIAKSIDGITDNASAVKWLLERQAEVTDINHHLQIDNVIIDILS